MKNLTVLSILFLITFQLTAAQDSEELQELFWKDPDAQGTEYPSEWSDESAIVLYNKVFYEYYNNGRTVHRPYGVHKRILILDQNSRERFSTFEFEQDERASFLSLWRKDRKSVQIGIKIIKPDGSTSIIDVVKERIEEDDDTYKLAVPGLEIGDILDYYYFKKEVENDYESRIDFDPIERTISSRYPTVYYEFSLELENDFYARMDTYNGAPEIEEFPTDRRATRMFKVIDKNVPKFEAERFVYPLVDQPSLAVQVQFALKRRDRKGGYFFPSIDNEMVTQGIDEDYIKDWYEQWSLFRRSPDKEVKKYFRKKDFKTQKEFIYHLARYLQFKQVVNYIDVQLAAETGIFPENWVSNYYQMQGAPKWSYHEGVYLEHFRSMLEDREIPYQIFMGQPRHKGELEDLAIYDNMVRGFKIAPKDQQSPIYITFKDFNEDPWNLDVTMQGAEVFLIDIEKKNRIKSIKIDKLPVSKPSQTVYEEHTRVEIQGDWEGFKVNRTTSLSGNYKELGYQMAVSLPEMVNQYYDIFNETRFFERKIFLSKKMKADYQEQFAAMYDKFRKNHKQNLISMVERDYDVEIEEYSFDLLETSLMEDDPVKMSDNFEIGTEWIKKAGDNYIVEVGQFIGAASTVDDEDRVRSTVAHTTGARSTVYRVEISIPQGYEVTGLERLNMDISNSTGSFKSAASVENGKLVFDTKRKHVKHDYSLQEWPLVLEWMDASHKFSEEKVLFKKKS